LGLIQIENPYPILYDSTDSNVAKEIKRCM
jgi:hypothetical protein